MKPGLRFAFGKDRSERESELRSEPKSPRIPGAGGGAGLSAVIRLDSHRSEVTAAAFNEPAITVGPRLQTNYGCKSFKTERKSQRDEKEGRTRQKKNSWIKMKPDTLLFKSPVERERERESE